MQAEKWNSNDKFLTDFIYILHVKYNCTYQYVFLLMSINQYFLFPCIRIV